MQGYRTAVDVVSSAEHGVPAQVTALSARTRSKPTPGSLDHEVVLSRRLIQNCCPYLEDVLALIRSLGRAWKLGLVAGGNGPPFRLGQSPRVVGLSGMSPRSRRVIKPHSLKPIRVLPSLPEQHQRGDSSSVNIGTGRGDAHAENARLRLVEAFFHSLPDELQVTADFVARRSVQNACEDVLAEVIRPAVVAAVSRLDTACTQVGSVDQASPASSSLMTQFSRGTTNTHGEGLIRKRVDQVMVAMGKTLQFEAMALAGKRGKAIATATTLSLAPLSLSLRYLLVWLTWQGIPCPKARVFSSLNPVELFPHRKVSETFPRELVVLCSCCCLNQKLVVSPFDLVGCARWQRRLLGTMHGKQPRGKYGS